MTFYYFDTETTGKNPLEAEVVSIQYGELGRFDLNPRKPLIVLKAWVEGEESVLKTFSELFHPWAFIPLGQNLHYDYKLLSSRFSKFGLWHSEHPMIGFPHPCRGLNSLGDILEMPDFEVKHLMVANNRFSFKGYDEVTYCGVQSCQFCYDPEGHHDSKYAAGLIAEKNWEALEIYIQQEYDHLMAYLKKITWW